MAEKTVELLLQTQKNAADVNSFMQDLQSWEQEMKEKDRQLLTGQSYETAKHLPPVRNRDYKKKKKEKKEFVKKQTKQRIKSYDYQAWENFDVDEALESMDAEVQSTMSDTEDVAVDQELVLAEQEKGHAFFRDGQYDSAIECYTKAMEADPHNALLPSDRAACFLKLNKFAVAESDCNLALALDSECVSAYCRRTEAHMLQDRPDKAGEDCEVAFKLDPKNQEVLRLRRWLDLKRAEYFSKQEAVLQKENGNYHFRDGNYVAAVECYTKGMKADPNNAILPANRAMVFLKEKSYHWAEVDCSTAIAIDPTYCKAFARRATARAALGKSREAIEDFQQVLKLEPGNKHAINEINKLTENIRSSALLVPEENSERRTVTPITKPEHLRSTKPMRKIEIQEVGGEDMPQEMEESPAISSDEAQETDTARPEPVSIPPPPSTNFELVTALMNIGSDSQATYQYLKQINPKSYSSLFQNWMEPKIFTLILKTFHSNCQQHNDLALLLDVLKNFVHISRFGMTVMFLSSTEKRMLQDMFSWIRDAGLDLQSLPELEKSYQL